MALVLSCDGSSTNHAGPKSLARWAVADHTGKIIHERKGFGTNNEAEYKALITALYIALGQGDNEVVIHLDSELILKQVRGVYEIKNDRLKKLNWIVNRILDIIITLRGREVDLRLIASEDNPAHVTVGSNSEPNVFDGIEYIVRDVGKYHKAIAENNGRIDEMAKEEGR